MKGYKRCPRWLHNCYRKAVRFSCQRCGRHEDECGKLIPHRIIRGNQGGLYTVVQLNHKDNNIKVCCFKCHKLFHMNDNKRVRAF